MFDWAESRSRASRHAGLRSGPAHPDDGVRPRRRDDVVDILLDKMRGNAWGSGRSVGRGLRLVAGERLVLPRRVPLAGRARWVYPVHPRRPSPVPR